jgi:hypothetical protein
LCFEVVDAIFRLRKLLEFNISIAQTKVCGYKTEILTHPQGEGKKYSLSWKGTDRVGQFIRMRARYSFNCCFRVPLP